MDAESLFKKLKKISVVTINYNNAIGLKKTIESVVSQVAFDSSIEYIVIDGGSSDSSLEIILQNERYLSYWVSEKDNGIFFAMNKGIQIATGEYIIFMNSGDVFTENVIDESLLNQLQAQLVYGDFYLDKAKSDNYCPQTKTLDFAFLISKTICHQSLFMKREVCVKYPFETNLNLIGDWIQLFRIMKNENPTVRHIPRAICVYDTSGVSIRFDSMRLDQRSYFLTTFYGQWELESLNQLGRLRTRKYFHWIVNSLNSNKKSLIIEWLSRII